MNKSLFITIIAFCIAVCSSFQMGKQAGRQEIYAELSRNQKITLNTQKDLKESLANQAEFNEQLNTSFDKTTEYFKEIPITIMNPPELKEIIVTVVEK